MIEPAGTPSPHHNQQQPPNRMPPLFGPVGNGITFVNPVMSGKISLHIRVMVLFLLLSSGIGLISFFFRIFAL
jgi:hypothetical protein